MYSTSFPLTLEHKVVRVIEGWVGRPKGIMQVLYKRDFIDHQRNLSDYSLDGKKQWKDENGVVRDQYLPICLRYTLSQCIDFKHEITAMEDLAVKLSTATSTVKVLYTPKYHCEIAGEGVEYSWGISKKFYRSLPLSVKKGLVNFRASVRQSVNHVSIHHVRKFAARARRYMLAYLHFDDNTTDVIVSYN